MTLEEQQALRWKVGTWMRARAAEPLKQHQLAPIKMLLSSMERGVTLEQASNAFYTQMAADAEHSDLLMRLFGGEEMRP